VQRGSHSILIVLILATAIVGCTTVHVDTYKVRKDLIAVYRDSGTSTTRLQGYRVDQLSGFDNTYTSVAVVYRDTTTSEYRSIEGVWSLENKPTDSNTKALRAQKIASRLDARDRLSLFRGMSVEDIVRSVAVDHHVVLEQPRGDVKIPMWIVESIIPLAAQPAYQDTVDARGSYEINVDHIRSDLKSAYQSGSADDVAITGAVASEIGAIPPGEKIIIAYRDSTDSVRIEVGKAVGPLAFVRVDSVVREQRMRQILARPIPTSKIGLFRGLENQSVLFWLAVTGVMEFRQDLTTTTIPLWKVESVAVVKDQKAYLEYVEPMDLALEVLLSIGAAVLVVALVYFMMGGKEMSNVDLY